MCPRVQSLCVLCISLPEVGRIYFCSFLCWLFGLRRNEKRFASCDFNRVFLFQLLCLYITALNIRGFSSEVDSNCDLLAYDAIQPGSLARNPPKSMLTASRDADVSLPKASQCLQFLFRPLTT
jgi:hypothetical protein